MANVPDPQLCSNSSGLPDAAIRRTRLFPVLPGRGRIQQGGDRLPRALHVHVCWLTR